MITYVCIRILNPLQLRAIRRFQLLIEKKQKRIVPCGSINQGDLKVYPFKYKTIVLSPQYLQYCSITYALYPEYAKLKNK